MNTIKSTDFLIERLFDEGVRPSLFWTALILSVLIHLMCVYILPNDFLKRTQTSSVKELEPVLLELVPAEPEEMRFVEVNPEVADNVPDQTKNYSFMNQQSANAEAALLEKTDAPFVAGEEVKSQKIVEGTIGVMQEASKVSSAAQKPTQESVSNPAMVIVKELNTPTVAKSKSIDSEKLNDGKGIQARELEDVTGDQSNELQVFAFEASQANEQILNKELQVTAQPRPRLNPKLLSGPLMKSNASAARRGTIAIDASFSEFGEYKQQFFAALLSGWFKEIEFYQPIDVSAHVLIRLTLHADGSVSNVEVLHSSASEIATLICKSAISKRSPFRPWSDEMLSVYGEAHNLDVKFIYR